MLGRAPAYKSGGQQCNSVLLLSFLWLLSLSFSMYEMKIKIPSKIPKILKLLQIIIYVEVL